MGRITPEQLAASGTEHGHQCAVFQWAASCGVPDIDLLHAIPNGGDRNPHVGAKMKAEGVKRGVPDMFWPVPIGIYAGLYIELKIPKRATQADGGLSEYQIKWLDRLRAQHYACVVAYGWVAATRAIALYVEKRLVMPNEPGPLRILNDG